jgi:anti-sigma regulatory factor (Ser/Thr protein kinase)
LQEAAHAPKSRGVRGSLRNVIAETVGEAGVHYLAAEASSVPEARRIACEIAEPFLDQEQFRAFELVVSEVVSNAVRHGAAPDDEIRLAVTPKDGYMCVQVTDLGPGLIPRPGVMGPQDDDGGFGLFIVETLTRRWGVTREEKTTRVWFEIDFTAVH